MVFRVRGYYRVTIIVTIVWPQKKKKQKIKKKTKKKKKKKQIKNKKKTKHLNTLLLSENFFTRKNTSLHSPRYTNMM